MSLVPRLRFKEFRDAWVEKKLGDVGDIITGSTPNTSNGQFYGGHYMFVSPTDIQQNRYIRKTTKTLTKLGLDEGRVVEKNSVCFVCIGSTIGKVGQLNDIAITNQQINTIKTNKDNSDDFIFSLLESKRDSIKNQANTHAIPIINKSLFSNILFYFPFLSEQQKIASFLTAIDKKIEGLQKKESLLKKYKQCVLQKIFNQEIRFKQDDGSEFPAWVEKKLGDIALFSKGKGISKSDIVENGLIECIRYGELYTNYNEVILNIISKTNIDKNDLILSKYGDIIIPASGETAMDISKASCILRNDVALSGDINIIRTQEEGIFLSYYLTHIKKKEIAKLAQGSTVIHLYNSSLAVLKLNLPPLAEQQKIANFLTALDQKISLTTTQLEKTKQYKTALLQQLFI
jgi:type I restriction enzyme S subunit